MSLFSHFNFREPMLWSTIPDGMPSVPDLVTVPPPPTPETPTWHAGGGGSRERLHDLQHELQPQPTAPTATLEELVKKYWLYGVVAVVGLSVLKKL
jgi:hypothetical protein